MGEEWSEKVWLTLVLPFRAAGFGANITRVTMEAVFTMVGPRAVEGTEPPLEEEEGL